MNHIDLFSGIGGFAYAARQVWGEDYKNICFCDNNKFCQAVLRKNFGEDIKIYDDIRKVTADASNTGVEGVHKGKNKIQKVGLLTGGFPCQPFSQAGKRKGTDDDRYLWPEMLRVIREFNPTWVIAENVRGLLTIGGGVVFEQVCADLEGEAYEVQPVIIPACAVNAPHRRDRIWFIAHTRHGNGQGEFKCRECKEEIKERHYGEPKQSITDGGVGDIINPKPERLQDRYAWKVQEPITDKECKRSAIGHSTAKQFDKNWLEVATELCGVDDGIPARMDGLELSKSKHRVERLKALGNSVVPQVVVQIMKGIKVNAA